MGSGRWAAYQPESSGRFVNKDVWAEQGVVFSITKIEETSDNDKYGAQWHLTVVPDGGEEKILAFTKGSQGRDEAINAAADDLDAGKVQSIGPLVLVKVRTKAGRPFFTIEDADEDDAGMFDGSAPAQVSAGAADDELPF